MSLTSASSRIFRSIGMATRFSIRSGAIPGKESRHHRRADDDDGIFALREIRIEADAGDQQADHGRDGEAGPRQTKSREKIHGACSSRGRSFTFWPSDQIGDAGRCEDIARRDAFSDDQTVVANPTDRDGALLYG